MLNMEEKSDGQAVGCKQGYIEFRQWFARHSKSGKERWKSELKLYSDPTVPTTVKDTGKAVV